MDSTLGIAFFQPEMVDDVDVLFLGSVTLLGMFVGGDEMGVVLLHGFCKLSAGFFDEVLEVETGFARVVGKAYAQVLEPRYATFRNRVVEELA